MSSVKVDWDAKDSCFRMAGRPSDSRPNTSSSSLLSIDILASKGSPLESLDTGLPPANSGAGGNGLFGLL
jgi:hypothetical protein